ncbi:MAG: energy-coupling factor transporter transmembrane component T [Clostridiales bacterium]|jgi:energy-coupling factor transport system permease protein|nr:energy-coupling factor transporter transmembrane protein EcfT [Eubacteriales bacterium]MDH7566218.1 energy-coupling factor transporter transmembrane component T [Clostridiales bacterium]
MDRGFSSVHPAVCFTYYIFIILFAMLLFHPVYLLLSIAAQAAFLLLHGRGRARGKSWVFFGLMGLAVLLINPLINHRGSTILFYLFDNPITLEATVYGAMLMLSLLDVLAVFACYQQVVDNHKFMYLFSSFLPKTAFLLMMCMRFVPLLLGRMKQISVVQKTRGLDMTSGPVKKRSRDGMQILHILITWSLEEALQTADSMKARGYGVTKRSCYWDYKMGREDRVLLAAILVLAAVTAAGSYLGYGTLAVYPTLGAVSFEPASLAFYGAFCLLLLIPIFVEGKEILLWRS